VAETQMLFEETFLSGVVQIHAEKRTDERGFFARTWCAEEFKQAGLDARLVQCSISFNARKGTLRGMHYQLAPYAETKLVRCTMGAIYDVVLDLRRESPTFKKWTGMTLTAENREMVYIPTGCAHGFVTLEDRSEVFYQMSESYHPQAARGVRWNDPAFGIEWPEAVAVISERDRTLPDFQ
jgi:dTDP-4-dehydrorhamnose 3,5-epimerase